jgi:hypothetical protein
MATLITDKTIHDFELSLQEYDDEYLKPFVSEQVSTPDYSIIDKKSRKIDIGIDITEREKVSQFLSNPCPCGQNCQQLFTVGEVLEARDNFRLMSWAEQHSFIVGKLQTFMRASEHSVSARKSNRRERQKFDYFIVTIHFP